MDTKVGHEHKVQSVLLLSWHLKIEQRLQQASLLLLPWYNSSTAVALIVTRNSSEIRMMIGAWRLVFVFWMDTVWVFRGGSPKTSGGASVTTRMPTLLALDD